MQHISSLDNYKVIFMAAHVRDKSYTHYRHSIINVVNVWSVILKVGIFKGLFEYSTFVYALVDFTIQVVSVYY